MAYEPIQNPKWSERDALPQGDQRKIILADDFNTEFNNIKAEFDRINRHGIIASCKYNGTTLKYQDNVTSVSNGWNGDEGFAKGRYRVYFESGIPEFDEHYSVQISLMPSFEGVKPAYAAISTLQGFNANWVDFTVTELSGGGTAVPDQAVGFSLIIVDMAQD